MILFFKLCLKQNFYARSLLFWNCNSYRNGCILLSIFLNLFISRSIFLRWEISKFLKSTDFKSKLVIKRYHFIHWYRKYSHLQGTLSLFRSHGLEQQCWNFSDSLPYAAMAPFSWSRRALALLVVFTVSNPEIKNIV